MGIESQNSSTSVDWRSITWTADYLGVTERTVGRFVDSGAFPALRMGQKALRVRQADVEALLRPISAGGAA